MARLNLLRFGAAALALTPALAHTWVEQLQLIDQDTGNYTGNFGYPRGYVSRTDPGFDGFSNMQLLPSLASERTRVDNTDLLCHPAQRVANSSAKYPVLKAAPGSFVAIKYLENGHVSLPNNQKGKPAAGGTVYVFATTDPKSDEKITDVLAWTQDGSGGDGRGQLLIAQNYDDGRCYQINGGEISVKRQKQFPNHIPGQPNSAVEQWCEADVQLPQDIDGNTLTLYYVWDWPTAPGQDPGLPKGKDEFYVSCMDINVSNVKVAALDTDNTPKFRLDQQDPQLGAVAQFQSRTAVSVNADREAQSTSSAPQATGKPKGSKPASQPATVTVTERITTTVFAQPSKRNARDFSV